MRFLKRFLPKLPTCPYCGTIYRYGDVAGRLAKRGESCYHCGGKFRVVRVKLLFLLIELLIIGVAADMAAMLIVTSVAALFIINIVLAAAGLIMIPFYIEYVKR